MPPTPADFDLGRWEWRAVCVAPAARPHFNRGLQWMYGYNHEQACADFTAAVEADAQCGIAMWCMAYCLGPNYNCPWVVVPDAVLAKAVEWLDRAEAVVTTRLEKALCVALRQRYPEAAKGDTDAWNTNYAAAMSDVAREHPRDVDVLTLAAEAMMGITPWKLWDAQAGTVAPPPARTRDAIELLEAAQGVVDAEGLPQHAGVCHFLLHAWEMSPTPERGLRYYDLLVEPGACPAAPHLLHMGTHCGVLCGDYRGAVRHNKAAVAANKAYFAFTGTHRMFYLLYMLHDYHFWMYGAMFDGRYAEAMNAADGMWEYLDDATLRWDGLIPAGLAVFAEAYRAQRYHVLVRFGKWDAILGEPFADDRKLHCVGTATLHYARALAYALGKRDAAAAEQEVELFEAAYSAVPPGMGRTLHNNTACDLLDVAREVMRGEVAFACGKGDDALLHLRNAVALDEALPYDEPWGVMTPTRHALGAVLLELAQPEAALAVYQQDLGATAALPRCRIHPNNVWAMLGVADAHAALRRPLPHDFKIALATQCARADPDVRASCFCRLSVCCKKAAL
eukprot:TRINITY_DN11529_c0_g1_i4.p1 TRINITY_DN11529_c0_g1~~TRINITY_DN11529_c0_g1_i4.p1  ORF type:complete len:564 (+),score=151.02 TRINITY_DN11529_c0_g1_i4:124-1815(+)